MPAPGALSASSSTRGRRWIIGAIVLLVVIIVSGHTFAVFYTDALWFSSINLHSVWLRLFEVKAGLMVVFSAVFAVLLLISLIVAGETRNHRPVRCVGWSRHRALRRAGLAR